MLAFFSTAGVNANQTVNEETCRKELIRLSEALDGRVIDLKEHEIRRKSSEFNSRPGWQSLERLSPPPGDAWSAITSVTWNGELSWEVRDIRRGAVNENPEEGGGRDETITSLVPFPGIPVRNAFWFTVGCGSVRNANECSGFVEDKNFASLGIKAIHGAAGVFVGMLNGFRKGARNSFRSWAQNPTLTSRRSPSGGIELSLKDPIDGNVQIVFDVGVAGPRLREVRMSGGVDAGSAIGNYPFGIEYQNRYRYDYDESRSQGWGLGVFPVSVQTLSLVRYKSEGRFTGYFMAHDTTILAISERIPRPNNLEELLNRFDVAWPDGMSVTIASHEGIDFEWRDGAIVRRIDRKRLDSISGFRLSNARWTIPVLGLFVLTCVAAFLYWRRKFK
ncbi:MAG: hypothetical protein KatS3mg111_0290 [Pirellulaceae bacterium]|nr:MAG: hypothetical protein KatS3mg111_0290 [Pirellulaceae bacterium]